MFKILNRNILSNLELKPGCSSLPRYYMCHYVWKEGREGGDKEGRKEEGRGRQGGRGVKREQLTNQP